MGFLIFFPHKSAYYLGMNTIDLSHAEEIYSISRLNREVKYLLEGTFPPLWVEGEISNFSAPQSGHWYFCLKDSMAQVRCAMFRPQNRRLNFTPQDGMQLIAKARISLYEGRGDFQLIVELLEEAGIGKLQKEFEALKKRLSAAGLFDPAHKKPLPIIPQQIGIITSPTGAAIRDILSVLQRRFPALPVILYPTLVQGETAAPTIVKAIQTANQRQECDVLILARGGGSLEDLWSFNEEIVAQAIFQSRIPIMSGVGHEIDFTIADFVADQRAPTPSAAAELATPDQLELLASLQQNHRRFTRQIQEKLAQLQQHIQWVHQHLQQQHPKKQLLEKQQFLDQAELSLIRSQQKRLTEYRTILKLLRATLLTHPPLHLIQYKHHVLHANWQRITAAIQLSLQHYQQKIATFAATLDAVSPLATLQRGYAIAVRKKDHAVVRHTQEVAVGEKIEITLMDGKLDCVVEH